jgi:hypothetical protein
MKCYQIRFENVAHSEQETSDLCWNKGAEGLKTRTLNNI